MSVANVQQYTVILEGLEIVAHMITKYRIVESLYLDHGAQLTDQLRSGIVELYTLLLSFLCKARRFYEKAMLSE